MSETDFESKLAKRYYFIILFLFVILTGCSAQSDESDFDNVCQYFEQLDTLTSVDSLSNIQRNDFIFDKIDKNLPQTSNARAAWIAIDSAIPEVRYELFKSAAESVINKQWQCSAMMKWAPVTGEL